MAFIMRQITSREIRLASRPKELPSADNFSTGSVELPELAAGQVLVRNLYMSVDPYMRGRMNERKSYLPPFEGSLVAAGKLNCKETVVEGIDNAVILLPGALQGRERGEDGG